MLSTKLITLVLLGAMALFMTSALLLVPPTNSMDHGDCFSEQCGPIQHLLHSFTLQPETTVNPEHYYLAITITTSVPATIPLVPATPPPRIT